MYIELTIENHSLTTYHVPDVLLKDVEGFSKEENFKAREKIISMMVEQIRKENEKYFHRHDIHVWLCFKSKGAQAIDKSEELFQDHFI